MMQRFYKKMRTAVMGMVLCAFLGACGGKEELVLLSSGDNVQETSATVQGEPNHGAAAASGQSGTEKEAGAPEAGKMHGASGEGAAEEKDGSGSAESGTNSADSTETAIFVYVCGAVAVPGVVELPENSRADDALRAAGGFLEAAERDYVNLAARVEDGQMLYFPTEEEAKELKASGQNLSQAETEEEDGTVNINTADKEQLCTLPGIGESRASDIIAYREANGGFGRIEEIMNVPGIKEGAYEKLKAKIRTE